MVDVFEQRAKQIYTQDPKLGMKNPYADPFEQRYNSPEFQEQHGEGFFKSAARYGFQVPLGIAQATLTGIVSNLMQAVGTGSAMEEEELEQLRKIHERLGIPFDEEKYMESLQQASEMFPTPSNLARMGEEATGLPLTPQTKGQKLLQLAASAGKFQTGATSQKLTSAAIAPSGAVVLEKLGLPEAAAEFVGLLISGAGKFAPEVELGKATKPSGMIKQGFEKVEKPTTVSEKKLGQINKKVEKDFRDLSDKIIEDSPIGETAENLRTDPTFREASRELLNQAQEIADTLPGTISIEMVKKEFANEFKSNIKGFRASEYDKEFSKFMKTAIDNIYKKEVSAGDLVSQYRNNNRALTEYYEPGASKALNRAKKDALLAENRAITKIMEQTYPESELVPVFKEGNDRWTKIKNIEEIDNFINDIFPENRKLNFKDIKEFFDDPNYQRIFKKSLGEEGYANFEQIMKDMMTSEVPYKMLKIGKQKGFFEHVGELATAFIIHPKVAQAKGIYDLSKYAYRGLMNAMLDKPQIGIKFNKTVKEIKKGDFAKAEKDLEAIQAEILPKEETPSSKMAEEPTTLEAKTEKIEKPTERISAREQPKLLEAPIKKKEIQQPKLIEESKRVEAPKVSRTKSNTSKSKTKIQKDKEEIDRLFKKSGKLPKPVKKDYEWTDSYGKKNIEKNAEVFDDVFGISKESYGWKLVHIPTGVKIASDKLKKHIINILDYMYKEKLFDKNINTNDPEKLLESINEKNRDKLVEFINKQKNPNTP